MVARMARWKTATNRAGCPSGAAGRISVWRRTALMRMIGPVKKVLVPVDFSDTSGRRFAEAGEIARPPAAFRGEQNP